MADILYYVSVTNGNDSSDGLTPETAWKTLTKAATAVTTPLEGNNHKIVFAPGVYREKFIPANSGRSATEKIYFVGDPHCLHFPDEAQGKCRITGTDAQEMPTLGAVLDWVGRTNVELQNCQVDGQTGSTTAYAVNNIPICRNVQVISVNGFNLCTCYNCKALCGYTGFNDCVPYNCTAIGCSYYGFLCSNISSYNCIAIGCVGGFLGSASSSYNCIVIGCGNGFSGNSATFYYNCIVIGSNTAFANNGVSVNCIAICSTTPSNLLSNIGTVSSYAGSTSTAGVSTLKHIDIGIDPSAITKLLNINPFGLNKGNIPIIASTISKVATVNLTAERDLIFTPTQIGICLGASVYVASKAASGNITVALQKYVVDTWLTQKSKTLPAAGLDTASFVFFEWDTTLNEGDNNLTAVSNTWRIAITADAEAIATTLYGVNTTTPGCMVNIIPTWLKYDAIGQPVKTSTIIGAYDIAMVTLDQALYHTNAPAIKINGSGVKTLKLPVKKAVPVTVSYWVRHDGAIAGMEPMLIMSGETIEEVVDTHSTGTDTWEQLSVSITPPVDGVYNISLIARDSAKCAWFSDPIVT